MLFSVYCDVPDFVNNATANQETLSVVGLNTTLSSACTLGATTLAITSNANVPATPCMAWLLDGAQSEVVTITATTATTATLLSGTLAAHASGVSLSTAGTNGCLADTITRASAIMEEYCHQGPDNGDWSLYAQSRTEVYQMPTLRCAFDRDNVLLVRPYHFPVTALTSISIQMGATTPATLNLSNYVIPTGGRAIEVPYAVLQGTFPSAAYIGRPFPRDMTGYATVAYTGGACNGTTFATVPAMLRQVCFLITQDLLSTRRNPTGAAELVLGKMTLTTRLRGDLSGNSTFIIQTLRYLQPWMTPAGM